MIRKVTKAQRKLVLGALQKKLALSRCGGSACTECRVRLHDGSLDEAIISEEEAAATPAATKATLAYAEHIRLLIESARIRLAYAHDPHFAVSLSGSPRFSTLPQTRVAVTNQCWTILFKNLAGPLNRFSLLLSMVLNLLTESTNQWRHFRILAQSLPFLLALGCSTPSTEVSHKRNDGMGYIDFFGAGEPQFNYAVFAHDDKVDRRLGNVSKKSIFRLRKPPGVYHFTIVLNLGWMNGGLYPSKAAITAQVTEGMVKPVRLTTSVSSTREQSTEMLIPPVGYRYNTLTGMAFVPTTTYINDYAIKATVEAAVPFKPKNGMFYKTVLIP